MRFLVDENLPAELVKVAQDKGIEAQWVRDVLPGAKDSVILERLRNEVEVLVTRDIRFANLVLNPTRHSRNQTGERLSKNWDALEKAVNLSQ